MSSLDIQCGGDHYKGLPIQPVTFCQANSLRFCESSAIKYLVRHRGKGGAEDLKKAIHYIQVLLETEYGVQATVAYADEDHATASDATTAQEGKWEVVADKGTYAVRWSIPNKQGYFPYAEYSVSGDALGLDDLRRLAEKFAASHNKNKVQPKPIP